MRSEETPKNWLFLRGWAREQGHWGAFPQIFAGRVADAQVHCLDLPGAGQARGQPVPNSVAELARALRYSWLPLQRKHPGPWAVLGVSLGAMVAMQWVATHEKDFSAAVLINSSASNVNWPHKRLNLQILPDLMAVASAATPEFFEQRVLALVSNNPQAREAALPLWTRLRRERPVPVTVALRQLWAAARFRAPAQLRIPTLLLASTQDRLVSVSNSEKLAERLRAPIRFHPTAGHDIPLDDPEWVANEVQNFLSSGAKR